MTHMDGIRHNEYTARGRSAEALRRPGFARLLGDCARMAPHWPADTEPAPARVTAAQIHGVSVPPSSARLIASTRLGD
ncbi:hypothetical protein [Streptomyces sp. NPDC002054]|uniref:hypothetical protein n=1 Tax=Streptomyces sp. NPDC002054 TaxID=3154663 RepID=UPI00332C3806